MMLMTDSQVSSSPTHLTPDEALKELIAGNERYVTSNDFVPDFSVSHASAVRATAPLAGILGCADARVAAEMIFDRGPGDLFMVRVAGNFLSDYSLASLEYCVRFLGVPLLMVLGHTECGAVTSALKVVQERTILPGRLPFLIDAIEPAVHIAMSSKPDDLLNASIAENVRRQVNRLSTMSPVISDALEAGAVKIVGAIYDLDNGRVTLV
jgi:carbonic anhydrase